MARWRVIHRAAWAPAAVAGDRPVTQRSILEELSRTFAQQLQARRPQLYFDLLADTSLPQRRLNENQDIQLMFINERGKPVFYQVENLNAARTVSTDDVWPGGSGGFSLTGTTVDSSQLGVWDGGGVRLLGDYGEAGVADKRQRQRAALRDRADALGVGCSIGDARQVLCQGVVIHGRAGR